MNFSSFFYYRDDKQNHLCFNFLDLIKGKEDCTVKSMNRCFHITFLGTCPELVHAYTC